MRKGIFAAYGPLNGTVTLSLSNEYAPSPLLLLEAYINLSFV